jgi:hypothetical protein
MSNISHRVAKNESEASCITQGNPHTVSVDMTQGKPTSEDTQIGPALWIHEKSSFG